MDTDSSVYYKDIYAGFNSTMESGRVFRSSVADFRPRRSVYNRKVLGRRTKPKEQEDVRRYRKNGFQCHNEELSSARSSGSQNRSVCKRSISYDIHGHKRTALSAGNGRHGNGAAFAGEGASG